VHGRVSYHPQQAPPVYYDIHCEVQKGTVRHPQLPLPLDDLQAKLHCLNGELRLEKMTARSQSTELDAEGVARLPDIEKEFEVQVDLKHVMLGNELAARLPDKIRNLHTMFKPHGPTTIHVALARHEGQWGPLASGEPSQVSLRPEGVSLKFEGFPYPLHRASGSVDYNILNKHVEVDMTAFASEQKILLWGHWTGEGPQADVQFEFKGHGIPIDENLLRALPSDLQAFVRSFHATGKINVNALILHKPEVGQYENQYHVSFHDASIRWENFPYPLQGVSGVLDIYPKFWRFAEFKGSTNGGHVLVHGHSTPRQDEKGEHSHGIELEISGRNIALNHELRDALRPMPGLHTSWENFKPEGRLSFTALVKRPTSDIHDLHVQVDARDFTVRPTFFPYRIQDISGQFRFHHNRLEISRLRAHHDQAQIGLEKGSVDIHPRGGYYADLLDVDVQGLQLDEEFVQAVPRKLQEGARNLHLKEPMRLMTRVVVAQPPEQGKPPDVYWDSELQLYNANFTSGLDFNNVTGTLACVGRYNGRQLVGVYGHVKCAEVTLYDQPFKNVHARFQVRENTPDVLLVGLHAPIFSGDVTGQLRFDFNSARSYELNLTASQINVAEFGRQYLVPRSQLSGIGNARLYLTGLGSNGLDSIDGHGSIDIPRGHFYNVPFLFELLQFLGLNLPDRTAFEEFHMTYGIQGSNVNVQKLDLFGRALNLSGKGDYDLKSKVLKLDIYPMWGKIDPLLPPQLRALPTTVSKNLVTVEVRGKVGANVKDLKYNLKPVPVIVDPLLLLRDRIMGQPGQAKSVEAASDPQPAREPERVWRYRIWE
jgi:hypothetical protein